MFRKQIAPAHYVQNLLKTVISPRLWALLPMNSKDDSEKQFFDLLVNKEYLSLSSSEHFTEKPTHLTPYEELPKYKKLATERAAELKKDEDFTGHALLSFFRTARKSSSEVLSSKVLPFLSRTEGGLLAQTYRAAKPRPLRESKEITVVEEPAAPAKKLS